MGKNVCLLIIGTHFYIRDPESRHVFRTQEVQVPDIVGLQLCEPANELVKANACEEGALKLFQTLDLFQCLCIERFGAYRMHVQHVTHVPMPRDYSQAGYRLVCAGRKNVVGAR